MRLFYPAGAALLVVLTALSFAAALPNPWSVPQTAVELTSGGKFAARVPDFQATSSQQAASAGGSLLSRLLPQ